MRRRATHPRILVDANSRDEREEQLRGHIGPLATTKVACFPRHRRRDSVDRGLGGAKSLSYKS